MYQISSIPNPGGGRPILIEDEHRVMKLKKWLPAGPTEDGGERSHDLVQFIAETGGTRTIRVEDLVLL